MTSKIPTFELSASLGEVSDELSAPVLAKHQPPVWRIAFCISSFFVLVLLVSIAELLWKGIGIWGVTSPIGWGFAIVNFVWWIGIGHAGTFISAFLLLSHQKWRTSINRFAEAMTLFAVTCAALFPLLHLGRPWRFYWLLPYPNTMEVWPQFRSPLVWDEFAVFTYFTVSLVFWYVGLLPDLAVLRDHAQSRMKRSIYGTAALGWRGSSRQWHFYETAYFILAGLATPLVISVHSIVSLDFAAGIVPGWHDPIFPPYFVAGAIFSGFAMVLTIGIPLRKIYHLERYITDRHLDNMAKVMLLTGVIVAYGYSMEFFMAWYSGDPIERYSVMNRLTGPYAPIVWLLLVCNLLVPIALWFPRIRKNVAALFIISLLINVGMWSERFMIVVISLHRDFVPAAWGNYIPTFWDVSTLLGTLGLFLWLFLLFIRFIPALSMHELKELARHDE